MGINNNIYLYYKYGKKYTIDIERRIEILKLTKIPKEIIVFSEFEPSNLIQIVKPNIYIKGSDYMGIEIPEKQILNELNIQLIIQEEQKINSSSSIIFGSKSAVNFNK